jgi:hypothetical protein
MLRSWYREGRLTGCAAEEIRYTSCLKIRVSKEENKEVRKILAISNDVALQRHSQREVRAIEREGS